MWRTTLQAVTVIAIKAVAVAALFIIASVSQAAPTVICSDRFWPQADAQAGTLNGRFDPSWRVFTQSNFIPVAGQTGFGMFTVTRQFVEPGEACTYAGTSIVFMTPADYSAMINGFAVNETLHYGFMVLCLLGGFVLGWYMFGPKRRSVIDIEG
jgi:hypothetical protein